MGHAGRRRRAWPTSSRPPRCSSHRHNPRPPRRPAPRRDRTSFVWLVPRALRPRELTVAGRSASGRARRPSAVATSSRTSRPRPAPHVDHPSRAGGLLTSASRGGSDGQARPAAAQAFLAPLGVVAASWTPRVAGAGARSRTPASRSGRLEPARLSGSTTTSELLIAVAASIGFIMASATRGFDYAWFPLCSPAHVAAPIGPPALSHIRRASSARPWGGHHPHQHAHAAEARLDRRRRRYPLRGLRGLDAAGPARSSTRSAVPGQPEPRSPHLTPSLDAWMTSRVRRASRPWRRAAGKRELSTPIPSSSSAARLRLVRPVRQSVDDAVRNEARVVLRRARARVVVSLRPLI